MAQVAAMNSSPPISKMVDPEQARFNESKVTGFNRKLKEQGQQVAHPLGQTDFFQILSAQLANQDPLNPMEDKEFIAQMAQFSSLDQMKSMNSSMTQLSQLMKLSGQNSLFTGAVNLLGREATVQTATGPLSGKIEQIQGNEFPQVRIGNQFFQISDITEIQ